MARGGRPGRTTNPERVLFPEEGLTKGEIVDYYRRVAPVMVPHLRGRPLMLERYPEGIGGPGFYQKDIPDYFPSFVHRVEVAKEGGTVVHAVCDDEETLVYLANQGSLTFHTWTSRVDRLHQPDMVVFDLDPPAKGFPVVRTAARRLREVLEDLGLVPFLKTTGSRGLHVVAPLEPRADFEAVRAFAFGVAELLVAMDPGRLTTAVRKAKRGGRVFVDVLRNGYAQTAVAPYSVRARPGAPLSTPLDWDELSSGRLTPDRYTVRNLFRRLGAKPDPWSGMAGQARPLDEARRRLGALASRRAS
jgi:bifunctional non-homologous end joining protein LigD